MIWTQRAPSPAGHTPNSVLDLSEIPGVKLIKTWDKDLHAEIGTKLEIDVALLCDHDITARKVSHVRYTMYQGDGRVGEIRLPAVLPPNIIELLKVRTAAMKPNAIDAVTLPLTGHLFGNKYYVNNGWGICQETIDPCTVEEWISAFHESETRVSLSEDKRHVLIHFNKLSSEEIAQKRIENVRYCIRGDGQFSVEEERKVDGRYGHVEFEEADLPASIKEKWFQSEKG